MTVPSNAAIDRLQLTSTTAYVSVEMRALKAAMLAQGRAVLRTPSVAFLARAYNIPSSRITRKLRRLGQKPRPYRRKSPFPPSSSGAPAAPGFLALTG
jgi:hypothetical protein